MQRRWGPIAAAISLIAATSGPHKVVRNTPALEFNFEWPAEAAAIPALDSQLYTEAKRDLAEAQQNALEDQKLATQQKRDFNQHSFSMSWTIAGQSQRLLSLESDLGTFTGGAHPNRNQGSLLWDRRLNKEIGLNALFLRPDAFARLTRGSYCAALDKERRKRREGEKLGGDFDKCPQFKELAISLVDRNRNGRFDTIHYVASPYVAGPYVEGEYEVDLPVTSQLIAAIRPDYRNSFERQRQ